MEVLIVLVTALMCVFCFLIGVKTAQKVEKGVEIELPTMSPLKLVREYKEKKEIDKEQNKIETILKNIESYDGTSNHQKDVIM